MKIRSGFVSNSSSSSFCLFGCRINNDDEVFERITNIIDDTDFILYPGIGMSVFGVSAESLLQTMTLPQAKEKAIEMIKEGLGSIYPDFEERYEIDFIYEIDD